MNCKRFSVVLVGILALCIARYAAADVVVNIDFEAGVPGDTNHIGDDGPLSSPGGTLWNSALAGVDMNDLLDEFGAPTPFDVGFGGPGAGQTFGDPGINNLQDSGTANHFGVTDLLAGGTYEIAVYVGHNGGFSVRDASGWQGFFGFGDPSADGWGLPGTEGNGGDYFHITNLVPANLSQGNIGLLFQLDGTVTGLQINGPVPEPTTLALLALGGMALLRRSRR